MISFDQVLLLQKKVESAVQKIVELKSENDALRSKCSELTNALSEKTELLNSFTADEQKIESSIKDALNQLNTIEDTIVTQSGTKDAAASKTEQPASIAQPSPKTEPAAKPVNAAPKAPAAPVSNPVSPAPAEPQQSLDISTDKEEANSEEETVEEKFDIF